MSHNYPKILAPFARRQSNDRFVDETEWSRPEFKVLKDIDWVWTAKADGTSIGIKWDGERISFVGHTDKSQIPPKLLKYLQENFGTPEAESVFEDLYGEVPVTVYGEGISSETNENYGHPDGWFIAFDIFCETSENWWDRDAVTEFVYRFSSSCIEAPVMYTGNIWSAVEFVKFAKIQQHDSNKNIKEYTVENGYPILPKDVLCPYDNSKPLEGLVGRPPVELNTGNGNRIICKVKCKDYYVFSVDGN